MKQIVTLAAGAACLLLASSVLAQPAPMAGDPQAMAPSSVAPPVAGKSGRGGGNRFARMDANKDGKVTLAEFIAYQDSLFDRIDTAHKGQIVQADIDAAKASLPAMQAGAMTRGAGGGGHRGEVMEKLLDRFAERVAKRGAVTRAEWDHQATRRFEHLDVNHAGFLTPEAFEGIGAASAPPEG